MKTKDKLKLQRTKRLQVIADNPFVSPTELEKACKKLGDVLLSGIDDALNFWDRFTGRAYSRQYVAWHNARHPHNKIPLNKLSRTDYSKAQEMFGNSKEIAELVRLNLEQVKSIE